MYFPSVRPQARTLTVGAVPLLSLVLLVLLAVGQLRKLDEERADLRSQHQLGTAMISLELLLADIQVAADGFTLTGAEADLTAYRRGRERCEEAIAALRSDLRRQPTQIRALQQITTGYRDWVHNAAEPQIAERQKMEADAASYERFREMRGRVVGQRILNDLRLVLTRIDSVFRQKEDQEGRYLVLAVMNDMVNMETGQRGFLLTGLDSSLAPYRAGQRALEGHLVALGTYINTVANLPVTMDDIEEIRTLANSWFEEAAGPEIEARIAMNEVTTTADDLLARAADNEDRRRRQEMQSAIALLRKQAAERVHAAQAAVGARTAKVRRLLLGGGATILLVGLIGFYLLGASLTRELDYWFAAAREARAAVRSGATEADAANPGGEPADQPDLVAATVGAVGTSLDEVAQKGAEASRIAAQAGDNLAVTRARLEEMIRAAGEIGDALAKIEDVAEATNLLALNATIEAVSAGRAGRGFAQVARDVKELGRQTKSMTAEISRRIQSIKETTTAATRSIHDIGDEVLKIDSLSQAMAAEAEKQSTLAGDARGRIRGRAPVADA